MTGASFTYPPAKLVNDYLRASVGALFAILALFVPMHPAVTAICAVIAVLLLGFGARTWLRQMSRVVIADSGIAVEGPFGRAIPWAQLDRLRLRYYSTRKDNKQGWMELVLRGGGRRLAIESEIDGFEEIVKRAARAAAERHLPVDAATAGNLAAIGAPVPKPRQVAAGAS